MLNLEKNLKRAAIVLIVLVILFISYVLIFTDRNIPEDSLEVDIYFLNPSTNEIETEKRYIKNQDNPSMVVDIYNEFYKGPENPNLVKTFPTDVSIAKDVSLRSPIDAVDNKEGKVTARIVFSEEYSNLSPADEIIFRTSLVYTLTELPFIKDVEILVLEDNLEKNIVQTNGSPIGPMNRDNVQISPEITSERVVRKQIELYFANESLTGLVSELRYIEIVSPSDSSSAEQLAILEELIKGPKSDDLVNLYPSNLSIIDVNTTGDKTCYIDFNINIENRPQVNPKVNNLLLYSIVNTLALPKDSNVKKVQFLVNGEKTSTNIPFEPDTNYIIGYDESLESE